MTEFLKWLSNNPIASNTLLILIALFISSITIIYVIAFFQNREISFWPPRIGGQNDNKSSSATANFEVDRDLQGETGIDDIKNAKHTIHVTHFSGRTPQNDYIKTMMAKSEKDGIDITRVVPANLKNNEWLENFKKLGGQYKEKEVSSMLHFDMLIIDRNKVRLYFPASKDATEFKKAIIFNDQEVVDCFMTVFERLN